MKLFPVGCAQARNVACKHATYTRLACLLGLLAFSSPASAQDKPKEDVIYPRAAAVAPAQAVGRPESKSMNSMLLVLGLSAAVAGGWMLWRQRRSPQGILGREARKLNVAETRSLGNRQYLVVADYDGRKFLLGVCPGRIDLLSQLDESAPAPKS